MNKCQIINCCNKIEEFNYIVCNDCFLTIINQQL